MNKRQFRTHMMTLTLPEGFTGEFGERDGWDGKGGRRKEPEYVITKPDDVKITFDYYGGGHTEFKVNGFMASFDRTGVSDSFYWIELSFDPKVKPKLCDLNELVAKELEKIEKSRDYYKTAIKIPEIGHTTSPDNLPKLKAQLNKQGWLRFYPAGFGTGYMVAKKPQQRMRWGEKRASPELEKFLEHKPLYVTTFDHD